MVPLTVLAALFILAGGFVHLREWLEIYRSVPADSPGAAVVRLGFPVNAGVSVVAALAVMLVVTSRWSRYALPVIAGAFLFQAASLATLIATRTGSVLGWSEPIWTPGAEQTRAVEIGAMLTLAGAAALHRFQQASRDDRPRTAPAPVSVGA